MIEHLFGIVDVHIIFYKFGQNREEVVLCKQPTVNQLR